MGKHIPIRECICCRQKGEKQKFLKVVKNEHGFFVDRKQNQQGRGAYICSACLSAPDIFKKRPLDRAFRQRVPEEVYEALMATGEEMAEGE